ncbi:SIR2-like domain-containing protein [Paraburkholderia phenazinium]|uniref:SIR2-like domain-containing protein n=1 Tax=Paraburkholderia phenazinium TaxID=60549 RepID=A0A1G8NKY7_9BURK|nr:SIR2 family protein [Paraburkholderia phenazinium]SDI80676.1 SIR2-like domain-containing protein [Paraburkholderia phenazinium]
MIDDLTKLPDYPALQQFARALWRNGSIRGAAVLIGAGFTKNAIRPGMDTPPPPLWSDLARDLVDQLYSGAKHQAPTNPLRIAEEYRTYFGQAAMDDFIRARFPDRAWLPGQLHTELLEFPWSDILTTNWDTLLERAAESAVDATYDAVRSEADLPHARSPRIVKLHGSIGDIGPLIFAEEDYRTYPAKHAAFVNLARQIFIENELCLLGFSGDDPNFLQWAGWVRDQLGGNARRIYLVGNLDLLPARRKFLESHNIAPIDFAPIVGNVSPAEKHATATRLFFDALRAAKPIPLHEWPLTSSSLYPLRSSGTDVFQRVRIDDAFAAELLDKTAALLKADRERYPGWFVCPRRFRQSLQYGGDEAWLLRAPVLAHFDYARRAEILYELLWRRTTGFHPLPEQLVHAITQLLEAVETEVEPSRRGDFAVALMRHARLSNDDDTLDRWGKFIEADASAGDSIRMDAQYQKCLRARDRLNLHALSTGLAALESDDPIWQIRRAALLTEIGRYVEATKLIKDATVELEKRHRLDRFSLWIKARLGWAAWLSRGMDAANFKRRSDTTRPREFKDLLIDPLQEIEHIESQAQEIASKQRKSDVEVVPLFDPGHYRDSSGEELGNALSVLYELDQLIEVVGLPIRINNVGICSGAVISSVKITYQRTVDWYAWLLRALHSHFDESFNRYFGRVAIAQLAPEVSGELISIVNQAISYWFDLVKVSQSPEHRDDLMHAGDQLRLHLTVLSRLTVRMSEDEAQRAFERALELAKDSLIWHHWLLEALGELANYALAAISSERQGKLALVSMEFPLSIEKGVDKRFWPSIVQAAWESTPDRSQDHGRWKHRVDQLIQAARKSQPAREEAVLRLAYLSIHKVLTTEEDSAFGDELWSDTDGQEDALPSTTGLLVSTIAQLPSPTSIDASSRVRERLFGVDLQAILALPQPLDSRVLADKQSHFASLLHAKQIGLTLEDHQAVRLFDQLVSWTPMKPDPHDPFGTSMANDFTDRMLTLVGPILGNAVIPAMTDADRTEQRARALLEFISRTKAWHGLLGLPYFLVASPSMIYEVATMVRRGLVGTLHQRVANATAALVRWAALVKDRVLSELPSALIEQLIATIETRHEHGLHTLLDAAFVLLKDGFIRDARPVRLMGAIADLLVETEYADIDIASRKAVSVSLVRVECVKLAMALREHVDDDGTLSAWINAGKYDPLPEVRFSANQA